MIANGSDERLQSAVISQALAWAPQHDLTESQLSTTIF